MSTIKVDTYLTRGGASEIAIDKLKGASSAGSMLVVGEGGTNTTNLQQGLAKAFVNFNGESSIAARDSFNISSLDDDGTGIYGTNFSTSFSATDFTQTAVCGNENTSSSTNLVARGYAGTTTTSASGINTFYTNAGGTVSTDQSHNGVTYHGDLA